MNGSLACKCKCKWRRQQKARKEANDLATNLVNDFHLFEDSALTRLASTCRSIPEKKKDQHINTSAKKNKSGAKKKPPQMTDPTRAA
jgi:hypothetical protein